MEKTVSDFVYGTQYYRAPTPLSDEWEYDFKEMSKTGIDTIQLRIQWRWNEPAEGKYEFEDIDRLFELSEKYDRKVIIKFMMETAPDYIFHKYNGARKDMHGLPISPGAHGAYYVGGWWPCFENPDVMRKALDFVKVFTDRYKDKKNLILWNIWNEPRTRPIGDCGCGHSVKNYREWLKRDYGTIENLNNFFGKKWESFDTVNLPGMPHDYAETFLWRKWAMYAVSKRLKAMYDKVKSIDSSRPVMAHVGTCSVLQDVAGDGSDDVANRAEVDFYGTSFPTANKFRNIKAEAVPFMICDWLREVSEYFWVYELYPDWGDWCKPVMMDDFKFKVWSALACSAKGILYWQYRAERLGNENNLAGLVHIDGTFKEISHEARKIAEFIRRNEKFLMSAKVKNDGIGILYSQDSDMINRLENTGRSLNDFSLTCEHTYLYKKSLWGIYALFRELGYTCNWIDSRNLKDKIKDMKVLYIPEGFMISEENIEVLEAFARTGSCIIAEEGIGLRQNNTWLNETWPDARIAKILGAGIEERISQKRLENDTLNIFGHQIPAGEFISYLKPVNAEVIGHWSDGRAGACRKENLFFIGSSLGASFFDNLEAAYQPCKEILSKILESCSIKPSWTLPKGVYIREIHTEGKRMFFIFNRTASEQTIEIGNSITTIQPYDVNTILL